MTAMKTVSPRKEDFEPGGKWEPGWVLFDAEEQTLGRLASRIALAIERELFNHEDIREAIFDPQFILECERTVYRHVVEFTEEKVESLPSVVQKVVGGTGVAAKFERTLADDIAARLPDILNAACRSLEENADIRSIVQEKIERFEIEKVEMIVKMVARKELTMIEAAGAALGMMIGLIQLGLMLLFR